MEDELKDSVTELQQYPEPSYESVKLISTSYMNPIIWKQMKGMAETFLMSHALPKHIQNVAQAIMIMQAGLEMDMKPVEALQSLYIVNGAINIWGKATTRRLREHGYMIRYEEESDASCTAIVTKGKEKYTETFKFSDAEKSGWTKDSNKNLKVGWREGQNRKLKMRYGALSSIIKSFIPQVLGSANEVAEIAEDFEILDIPVNKPATPATPSPADIASFLKAQKNQQPNSPENTPMERAPGGVKQPSVPQGGDLIKKRKEYFALMAEIGVEANDAKEHIKDVYQTKSFLELTFEQLNNYVKQIRADRKANNQVQASDDAGRLDSPLPENN